jgi:gluconolactonase
LLLLTLLLAVATSAQTTAAASHGPLKTPLNVDRLDPASTHIVPANAKLERVATGFTWTEGTVWAGDSLYFADIPANTIHKWTPGKGVSIFLQPSGYKGSAPYGGPEPGSNGMTLDVDGRLTVAGHAQRDVYRFESLDSAAPSRFLPTCIKARS